MKVLINTPEKITKFVTLIEKLNVNADLGHGNITVDASSLIGVMAMDTKHPVNLGIHEKEDVIANVIDKIQEFIVEE